MFCQGGKGGSGCHSFGVPGRSGYGRPHGGNGGQGGCVYLVSDKNTSTFFGTEKNIRALNGDNGRSNMRMGSCGDDKVPVGTVVSILRFKDMENGVEEGCISEEGIEKIALKGLSRIGAVLRERAVRLSASRLWLLAQVDMNRDDMVVRVATGGVGGMGNGFGEEREEGDRLGKMGSSVMLQLDLATIADVGLVGLPNVGKSSLLGSITRARSRVADYSFTTLHPVLGMAIPRGYDFPAIKIADLPGIMKGAHVGRGLGLSFLKHVYRSRLLAFVVDLTRPDPFEQIRILRKEVICYDPELRTRPFCIVASKIDMDGCEAAFLRLQEDIEKEKSADAMFQPTGVFGISSVSSGVEARLAFVDSLAKMVESLRMQLLTEGKSVWISK